MRIGDKSVERKQRAREMNNTLAKLFPDAKIALKYSNNWELLVAVVLSAQCTDKRVNVVTEKLFKKYKNISDYANTVQSEFEEDVRQTGFFRNKAKNIIAAANIVLEKFGGKLPNTMEDMLTIPGVARKTANVVLGNAYRVISGIAVDTHVRRFVIRFDLSDYKDPVKIERDLMRLLPQRDWLDFTYRIIEYGRNICPARKHACTGHPLTKIFPKAASNWPKSK
jgi:endonuclease III